MTKNRLIIIGFIFFMLGSLSIILTLVGLKLDVIGFLYKLGSGFAFLMHIMLLCLGVAMMYVGKNIEKRKLEASEELEESQNEVV